MRPSLPHLLFAGCLAVTAAPLTAQNPGIFATNIDGAIVTADTFLCPGDVFLRGGPSPDSPCASPGLADGNYYFQVTEPAGDLLLSSDPITDREVVVTNGVISGTVGTAHKSFAIACGAKVVQLAPFEPSPDILGYTKVWLTPVAQYDPTDSEHFGFLLAYSWTYSFQVKECQPDKMESLITGYKWYDHTQDGIWDPVGDPLEVPIPGWRIEIARDGVVEDVTFTDENGRYAFIRPIGKVVYEIEEVAPGGFVGDGIPGAVWIAVTPRSGKVVPSAAEVAGPNFGNVSLEVKPGSGRTKGFWHNNNGRAVLANCPDWRQQLWIYNGSPVGLRKPVSSADPLVSLLIPPFPGPGVPTPSFFALPFLSAHNYFKAWIAGNAATGHAGFILSTQVAAAILNRTCGFMQFDAYIDRFQDGVLVPFDDMVAGATGLLSDPGAGLTGPNDPQQALRQMMLMCTNEFDSINSTGDLSEPQVVYGKTLAPREFETPYERTEAP